MAPSHYTRIVLAERPTGLVTANTFRTEVLPFDLKPAAEQIVVQVVYISLDPALRGYLRDTRSYAPPVQIGELMRAVAGIALVIEAGPGSKFVPGDLVSGSFGWTDYRVLNDKEVTKVQVPKGADLLDLLGPLGGTGITAYFGLLDVGKIKAGETLVVSGAAGATGSVVCQIGKKMGAKVYAIAGSPEKIEWLERELGVDKAFNYKSPTFHQEFKDTVGYFDVYYDNVGGELLNFALTRMKPHARIVFCGSISEYNNTTPHGLTNYMSLITQRAKIEGFLVFDYLDRFPEARKQLTQWLLDGDLKRRFHVVEGLQNAPDALNLLFSGGNTGKLVVKVSNLPQNKL